MHSFRNEIINNPALCGQAQSKIKTMKSIKKELENIISRIEEKIEDREISFDDHTDKWQESEKGEFFNIKTDELSDVIIDIEGAIECIDKFLE